MVVLLFFCFFVVVVVVESIAKEAFLFLVVGVDGDAGRAGGKFWMLDLSCDQHGMAVLLGSKSEVGVVGVPLCI